MSERLVWWVSQYDIEAIFATGDNAPAETLALPAYAIEQLESATGRSGRGRLWAAETVNVQRDIFIGPEWWVGPWATMAKQCAGIVIWAADLDRIRRLPGFVTDLRMESPT